MLKKRVRFLHKQTHYLREANGSIQGLRKVPKDTPNGKHDIKNAFTIGIFDV